MNSYNILFYCNCTLHLINSRPNIFVLKFLIMKCYTAPEEDKVYIMYHGTFFLAALKILQEGFRPFSNGMLECGVYLSRDLKGFQIPTESSWDTESDCESEGQCWESEKIDCQGHPLQNTWYDRGTTLPGVLLNVVWCQVVLKKTVSGIHNESLSLIWFIQCWGSKILV